MISFSFIFYTFFELLFLQSISVLLKENGSFWKNLFFFIPGICKKLSMTFAFCKCYVVSLSLISVSSITLWDTSFLSRASKIALEAFWLTSTSLLSRLLSFGVTISPYMVLSIPMIARSCGIRFPIFFAASRPPTANRSVV